MLGNGFSHFGREDLFGVDLTGNLGVDLGLR
jgi:hypothetical protein